MSVRSALRAGVGAGLAALSAAAAGPLAPAAGAVQLSGQVAAAGQPIADASVRLFAGGTRSATQVGATTTRPDGRFTLSYRRPAGAGTVLYAIADGGRIGDRALGRRVRLLSVAGLASAAPSTLVVDEQSTVAGAYALARFLDGARVSGPAPGLPNAVATAANLFESSTGKVSFVISNPPNGLATEVLRTFNTLANALASCTTGGDADCRRLLDAARPRGEVRPADTLAAAVAIARHPSQGTRELFTLARGIDDAYAPALGAAPGSWILALVYTGGGMNAPGGIAFDATANAWVTNNFEIPGTSAGLGATVLDPAGQPAFGSPITGGGVRGGGWGVAVDPRGRVWYANFAGDSMSLFDARGRVLSPPGGFTAGRLSRPQGVAVDARGNVWIANFGNDSVTLYPRGNPRAARSIRGGGISKPFSVAVDARGHAWVTNGAEAPSQPGSVTELLPDGTPTARSPHLGGGLRSPQGIALDSAANKWVGNLASPFVTRIAPDGAVSGLRAPSVGGGWGVAVDGADHVWVAGFLHATVTELCGVRAARCPAGAKGVGDAISPSRSGYVSAAFEHLTAVQIDPSGNVWLANNWTLGSPFSEFVGGNGLVQLVGAATPVVTPMLGLPRLP